MSTCHGLYLQWVVLCWSSEAPTWARPAARSNLSPAVTVQSLLPLARVGFVRGDGGVEERCRVLVARGASVCESLAREVGSAVGDPASVLCVRLLHPDLRRCATRG